MPLSRTPLSYAVAASVAAGAACGSATSPTGTGSSAAPAPRRIVVLGDSLAVSPNRSLNFVSELQARLDGAHPRLDADEPGRQRGYNGRWRSAYGRGADERDWNPRPRARRQRRSSRRHDLDG